MVSLARSSLVYDWRRYAAAVFAITFAGLLVLVQLALLLGLFGTVSVAIDQSDADLWIGYPKTQSVDLGRPLPPGSAVNAWMHRSVRRVEPVTFAIGDLRRPDAGRSGQSPALRAPAMPAPAPSSRGISEAFTTGHITHWQRLLAATTDIERAELERYSRLTLTGLAGIVASGFSGWLASDAVGWIVGAAGRLPLYDGGRIQARVDAAAAVRDERFAAYRRAVCLALAEVESALVEWQTARTALEFHASQLASRRQDAARRAEALELGGTDRAELLRLQLAASEAEATVITVGYQRMQAHAAVQRTLGR